MNPGPGRTLKLDQALGQRIIDVLARGHYRVTACRAAQVQTSTFYNWLKRGSESRIRFQHGEKLSQDDRLLMEFMDAVEEAEASGEVGLIDDAVTMAREDRKPEVLLKVAERRHPQHWRPRETVYNEDPPEDDIAQTMLEDPKLRELAADYEERIGALAAAEEAKQESDREKNAIQ